MMMMIMIDDYDNNNNNNNDQIHYFIYCVFSTDLLLQVSWSQCEVPEDGDYTETYSSNSVLNTYLTLKTLN